MCISLIGKNAAHGAFIQRATPQMCAVIGLLITAVAAGGAVNFMAFLIDHSAAINALIQLASALMLLTRCAAAAESGAGESVAVGHAADGAGHTCHGGHLRGGAAITVRTAGHAAFAAGFGRDGTGFHGGAAVGIMHAAGLRKIRAAEAAGEEFTGKEVVARGLILAAGTAGGAGGAVAPGLAADQTRLAAGQLKGRGAMVAVHAVGQRKGNDRAEDQQHAEKER